MTADWGALFENSTGNKVVHDWARDYLRSSVSTVFHREVNLAKARKQKKINELLAKLPRAPAAVRRRGGADKLLRKFFPTRKRKLTFSFL